MATQTKRKPAADRPMTPARRVAQENRQAREEAKAKRARDREAAAVRQRRRAAAAAPGKAAAAVTQRDTRYSAKHMLTAELIVGIGIVAIRAIADYEPQADGTLKGKVGHPKGQYGPLPILAGLTVIFFLLSFLAASGGTKAKLAVIGGAIVDLGLLMNSSAQFVKVSETFGDFGKAKVPPGSWVTSGTESGTPIQGILSGGGLVPGRGGGVAPSNPSGPIPIPKSGKCPVGWTKAQGQCWPNAQGGVVPF